MASRFLSDLFCLNASLASSVAFFATFQAFFVIFNVDFALSSSA